MVLRKRLPYALLIGLIIACGLAPTANADTATLVLTSAGQNLGFTLNTVVDGLGITSGCCGPLGNAVAPNGNIVIDFSNATMNFVFPDANNQTAVNAISSTSFTDFPPAFATSNGALWGSGGFSGPDAGKLVKLNNDGTINTVYSIQNLSISNGMWTNPVNGHLIAAGGGNLYDIDVSGASPTFRIIVTGVSIDGVTVSPDGKTAYVATGGGIQGYDIATGNIVLAFQSVNGSADGMGVITSSNPAINGHIVVNTNGGTLVLIDPSSLSQVVIASGGTRGDYASADPNGSLLLTQSDELMRLSCGQGCSVGGPPPQGVVPEPTSLLLFGSGLAALAEFRRRKLLNLSK